MRTAELVGDGEICPKLTGTRLCRQEIYQHPVSKGVAPPASLPRGDGRHGPSGVDFAPGRGRMMGEITVAWPALENEHGGRLLWFGSWLVSDDGSEGPWFYTGRGGEYGSYHPPPEATGLRVRRWLNEGLEPEYADVLSLSAISTLSPERLDFDVRQEFSRLPEQFAEPAETRRMR